MIFVFSFRHYHMQNDSQKLSHNLSLFFLYIFNKSIPGFVILYILFLRPPLFGVASPK